MRIEQLKLRTRCWKCNAIGHWGRECAKEVDSEKSKGNSSYGSSQTPSVKSGFFVSSEAGTAKPHSSFCFSTLPQPNQSQHAYWLREFVQSRKSASCDESAEQYKERSPFCGIVTESHEGVVDTAAESGLIETFALKRLEACLRSRGLRCKRTSKRSNARGVGGNAKVVEVVWIPIGILNINGILEATVVEGEVPLLLPVQLLKALRVVLDFRNNNFVLPDDSRSTVMNELPSGHVTIDVLQFARSGFCIPEAALHECQLEDLTCASSAVMLASSKTHNLNSNPCHGGAHRADESPWSSEDASSQAEAQESIRRHKVNPKKAVKLWRVISHHGQDPHPHDVHRAPRYRPRLVPTALGCIAGTILSRGRGGDLAERLCFNHHPCQAPGTFEELARRAPHFRQVPAFILKHPYEVEGTRRRRMWCASCATPDGRT